MKMNKTEQVPVAMAYYTKIDTTCYVILLIVLAIPFQSLLEGRWCFITTWDDDTNFLDITTYQSITFESLAQMLTMVRINVYEPVSWICKCFVFQMYRFLFHNIKNSKPTHSPWADELPEYSRLIRLCGLFFHYITSVILFRITVHLYYYVPGFSAEKNTRSDHLKIKAAACASTIIFMLHPAHAEVICWPSAQPYTLAGMFYASSVYSYLLFRWPASNPVSSSLWLHLSLGFAILAILSKSVAISLPAAIFCLNFFCDIRICQKKNDGPINRHYKIFVLLYRSFIHSFYHICVSTCLLSITIYANYGGSFNDIDTLSLTPTDRALKAHIMLMQGVFRAVWPLGLRAHYRLDEDGLSLLSSSPLCLLSFLTTGVITFLGLNFMPSRPHFLVSWAYFCGTMLPTLGVIQHGMVMLGADRYYYIPFMIIPIIISGCLLNFEVTKTIITHKTNEKKRINTKEIIEIADVKNICLITKYGSWWITFFFGVMFSIILSSQVLTWRNDETVWQHCLKIDPADWRSADQYAEYLIKHGRQSEAEPLFPVIMWHSPRKGLKAALHRAKIAIFMGNHQKACEMYYSFSQEYDLSAALLNNLAICHLREQPPLTGGKNKALELLDAGLALSRLPRRHKISLSHNREKLLIWEGLNGGAAYEGKLIF